MIDTQGGGFGPRLRDELRGHDVTRLELAARCSFDPFAVVAWLNGESVPTAGQALPIANLLEVPVGVVLRRSGDPGAGDREGR